MGVACSTPSIQKSCAPIHITHSIALLYLKATRDQILLRDVPMHCFKFEVLRLSFIDNQLLASGSMSLHTDT